MGRRRRTTRATIPTTLRRRTMIDVLVWDFSTRFNQVQLPLHNLATAFCVMLKHCWSFVWHLLESYFRSWMAFLQTLQRGY